MVSAERNLHSSSLIRCPERKNNKPRFVRRINPVNAFGGHPFWAKLQVHEHIDGLIQQEL